MYEITYEQKQQVHENCVHSIKVLNSVRDTPSLE